MNLCFGAQWLLRLLSGTAIDFMLVSFCALKTWLGNCQIGIPQIWLDRNVGSAPSAARVLLTVLAENLSKAFLSFGYLWEWLWILGE